MFTTDKKSIITNIIVTVMLLLLLAPIVVYTLEFGVGVWSSHKVWAEMGSAIGGIYAPILSVLTITLIMFQMSSQNKMNKHIYDDARLSTDKEEVTYYLEKLEGYLAEPYDENRLIREVLLENFGVFTNDLTITQKQIEFSPYFSEQCSQCIQTWIAIYPILKGIDSVDEIEYKLVFGAMRNRAQVLLGREVCIALDVLGRASDEAIDRKFFETTYFYS